MEASIIRTKGRMGAEKERTRKEAEIGKKTKARCNDIANNNITG